jgi:hypothetical protein
LKDVNLAAQSAREALLQAEKAFFHPEMVAMLYFPAEHLLAIYVCSMILKLVAFLCSACGPYVISLGKRIQDLESRKEVENGLNIFF